MISYDIYTSYFQAFGYFWAVFSGLLYLLWLKGESAADGLYDAKALACPFWEFVAPSTDYIDSSQLMARGLGQVPPTSIVSFLIIYLFIYICVCVCIPFHSSFQIAVSLTFIGLHDISNTYYSQYQHVPTIESPCQILQPVRRFKPK